MEGTSTSDEGQAVMRQGGGSPVFSLGPCRTEPNRRKTVLSHFAYFPWAWLEVSRELSYSGGASVRCALLGQKPLGEPVRSVSPFYR